MNLSVNGLAELYGDETRRYRIAVGIALVTLLVTSPIAWNYYDVHLYMLTWSEGLDEGWNVYATSNSQYPPLATYLFIFFEWVANQTTGNLLITHTPLEPVNWLRIVTRIPLIIGYAVTGHLIYQRWGWSTVRYWLLTPPVLVGVILTQYHMAFMPVSLLAWTTLIPLHTFWGYQFELLALPFVLSAGFSLIDRKPYRFAIYASIGAMIKLFPALLLPLALARFDIRETIKAAITSITIVAVITLPFLIASPHDFYYQVFGFQGERYPQGLSIFHIPLLLVEYQIDQFSQFSFLKWFWQVIWLPVYGYLVYIGWRTDDDDSLVLITGAVLLSFVLCNKVGNLNYVVWFWPYLLFAFDRGYLSWLYPTGVIATTSLFVMCIQFVAAVIDEPYLIIQDLEWYDAREIVTESFRGIALESMLSMFEFLNSELGPVFVFIYENKYVIIPTIILVHNLLLLLILLQFVRSANIYECTIELSLNPIQKKPEEKPTQQTVDG